eukprot:6290359-Amphidinium_carterae.1
MSHTHERRSHGTVGFAETQRERVVRVEDDDEVDMAYEVFLQRREVFEADVAIREDAHFKTELRGGKWTARHKALPCDAVASSARSPEAYEF